MKTTTINLNENIYTVHYEFTPSEDETRDTPGTQPSVKIWKIINENPKSEKLTDPQYFAIKDMCLDNEL